MRPTWAYILKCSDGSYYTGSYRGTEIETRLSEHNLAVDPKAYTAKCRPVTLAWAETFVQADDAVAFERQVKGWSRRKKEALIANEWEALPGLSKRGKA